MCVIWCNDGQHWLQKLTQKYDFIGVRGRRRILLIFIMAENSADFYYFHFHSDAVALDLVCLEAPQKTHHTDISNPSLQDDRGTRSSHMNRKSFFARRLLPSPSLPPRFGTTPLPAHDRARTQSSRKEFRVAIPKLLLAGLRSLLIDSGRSEPKWRRLSQTGYGCNVARK